MYTDTEMLQWRLEVDDKFDRLFRRQKQLVSKVEEHDESLEECRRKIKDLGKWYLDLKAEVAEQKKKTNEIDRAVATAPAPPASGGEEDPRLDMMGKLMVDMETGLRSVETRLDTVEACLDETRGKVEGMEVRVDSLAAQPSSSDTAADGDSVSLNGASRTTTEPELVNTADAALSPTAYDAARGSPPPWSTGNRSPPPPQPQPQPQRVQAPSTGRAGLEATEELAKKKAVAGCGKKAFVKTPSGQAAGAKVLSRFKEGAAEVCFRLLGDDEWLEGLVRAPTNTGLGLVELTQPGVTMYTPDGVALTTALENIKGPTRFGAPGTATTFLLSALEKPAEEKKKAPLKGAYTLFATAPSSGNQLERFAQQNPGKVVAALTMDEGEAETVRDRLAIKKRADGMVTVYTIIGGRKLAGKIEYHPRAGGGMSLINIDPCNRGHILGVWTAGAPFRPRTTLLPDWESDSSCPVPPAGVDVMCTVHAAADGRIFGAWERSQPEESAQLLVVRVSARLAWKKGDGGAGLKGLTRGTTVTEVKPGSPAERAGLRPQMVQLACDKERAAGGGVVESYKFKVPEGVEIKMEVGKDAAGMFVKPMGGAELQAGPHATSLKKLDRVPLANAGAAVPGRPALVCLTRSTGNRIVANVVGSH